jgi:hypothetical protein
VDIDWYTVIQAAPTTVTQLRRAASFTRSRARIVRLTLGKLSLKRCKSKWGHSLADENPAVQSMGFVALRLVRISSPLLLAACRMPNSNCTCQSGVNTLSHVTSLRPANAWALFSCI